jgi:hypothetical protein
MLTEVLKIYFKQLSKNNFQSGVRAFKGFRKVKGEVGFTMLAYNMRSHQHSRCWSANGFDEGVIKRK